MSLLLPPKRGHVGALSLDEIRQLRGASVSTREIAVRAGVTAKRVEHVLAALGLPYPHGGARHRLVGAA